MKTALCVCVFMGVLNWPLSNTTHGHLMASIGQQKLPVCVCVVSHDAAVQHLSCSDSDIQARAWELT